MAYSLTLYLHTACSLEESQTHIGMYCVLMVKIDKFNCCNKKIYLPNFFPVEPLPVNWESTVFRVMSLQFVANGGPYQFFGESGTNSFKIPHVNGSPGVVLGIKCVI